MYHLNQVRNIEINTLKIPLTFIEHFLWLTVLSALYAFFYLIFTKLGNLLQVRL